VRLVEVSIPAGKRETVLRELDEEGIDYVLTDETSGREYAGVVSFPLPTNAVEPVLERLREAGIDEQAYTVVVGAETVVSRQFEQLEERYAEEESAERIAREELQARAEELAPELRTYAIMTVVSALIATAGLLLDSPATVVGSMVIAPLIGPAMAASVGTVVDDRELSARGVKLQVLGIGLSVASAAAFAFLVRTTNVIPPGFELASSDEFAERLNPDVLSLVVAIGAGIAGAVSLTAGVSAAIVGVMIAVALIPPAATVGIGIAWGEPTAVLNSGVLTLVNLLSINLVALVVFRWSGYEPAGLFQRHEARAATAKRVVVLVLVVAVLAAFLGGVTYRSYERVSFESEARAEIEALLNEPPYEGATLLSLSVAADGTLLGGVTGINATVGRTDEPAESGLARAIRTRLARETGRNVSVRVRFVEIERA
jgi:uncharacterized hydrophobic protein (TIGR00341 family)